MLSSNGYSRSQRTSVSVRECPVENTSYGSGDDLECGKQKTIKCGQWEERKKKGKKKRVRRKEGE
jgi:hypothetical protein